VRRPIWTLPPLVAEALLSPLCIASVPLPLASDEVSLPDVVFVSEPPDAELSELPPLEPPELSELFELLVLEPLEFAELSFEPEPEDCAPPDIPDCPAERSPSE
jgi:hypothetical protein